MHTLRRPDFQLFANANRARFRQRSRRADRERADGIPDRGGPVDERQPFDMPLKCAGYKDLRIEPRRGYIAWRAVDADTGEVLHCAAFGALMRWLAEQVPRRLGLRTAAR